MYVFHFAAIYSTGGGGAEERKYTGFDSMDTKNACCQGSKGNDKPVCCQGTESSGRWGKVDGEG